MFISMTIDDSSALTMEILQACTKLPIFSQKIQHVTGYKNLSASLPLRLKSIRHEGISCVFVLGAEFNITTDKTTVMRRYTISAELLNCCDIK